MADDIAALGDTLVALLGEDRVLTSTEARESYSADLYARGRTCAAVIRPADRDALAGAVAAVTRAGYALMPRGAGLTYSGGYTPVVERCVVVDLSGLDRIVALNPDDMTITVEAGCTWRQIHDALATHGLRLPCFGTFSGARATVGGGLSGGAVFLGTARYGAVADALLALEVVLADGAVVRTGHAAFDHAGAPVYRLYGPDLTGLFVHDSGALGIKTLATFRVIRAPAHTGFASFAFADADAAARALSEIGRAGVAEDACVFDLRQRARSLSAADLRSGLRIALRAVRDTRGIASKLRVALAMAGARRRLGGAATYSLHVTAAAAGRAALADDLARCRAIATDCGGVEIADTLPRAVRAGVFPVPNAVVDPDGARWVALNAKVSHAVAATLIERSEAVLSAFATEMAAHGITVSRLMMAISNHVFSYEPVLHWHDEWLPLHRSVPEQGYLDALTEPGADPAARAVVGRIRDALLAVFTELGAASNQLGRAYPYAQVMQPETRELLERIKALVDPDGRVNPGVLGLVPAPDRATDPGAAGAQAKDAGPGRAPP